MPLLKPSHVRPAHESQGDLNQYTKTTPLSAPSRHEASCDLPNKTNVDFHPLVSPVNFDPPHNPQVYFDPNMKTSQESSSL